MKISKPSKALVNLKNPKLTDKVFKIKASFRSVTPKTVRKPLIKGVNILLNENLDKNSIIFLK